MAPPPLQFLLSMGPFTGHKGEFVVDYDDEAVRGALVLEAGNLRWPAPPLPVRAPPWSCGCVLLCLLLLCLP